MFGSVTLTVRKFERLKWDDWFSRKKLQEPLASSCFLTNFPKAIHPIHGLFSKSFCSRWSVATSRLSSGSCQGTPQKKWFWFIGEKKGMIYHSMDMNHEPFFDPEWKILKMDMGQSRSKMGAATNWTPFWHLFPSLMHGYLDLKRQQIKWKSLKIPWKSTRHSRDSFWGSLVHLISGNSILSVWSFKVIPDLPKKIVSSVGVGQDRVPRNSGMADHPISQPKKPHVATVKNLTGVEIYRKLWFTDPNLGASCKCSLTNQTND